MKKITYYIYSIHTNICFITMRRFIIQYLLFIRIAKYYQEEQMWRKAQCSFFCSF